ncbi:MAG: exodeoxyribonuclease VII large subunit [Tangfeifania sp.]
MEQKLTLFELSQQIKNALDETFHGAVWVVAEISEMKENRSGHCYLELIEKKEDIIIARARATIWSYTYRMLKPYFETSTGQLFTQGLKILVQVQVEYHPAYGLSLNIKDIDPAYTVGDLALQRKEIIERLQREGVFDMNKELVLPLVPQKIAVISSKTAAGYQDFMNQLETNPLGVRFYTHLFEAYMQGAEAVPSIISALERIFQYEDFFDAVAIIRGGGATADLSCFDNYELAFNVTQFPLPVITGIGHEKDDTITDMVAHTRMKTPTAVAEFFINGIEIFYDRLKNLEEEVVNIARENVETKYRELEELAGDFQQLSSQFINKKNNQLIAVGNKLQHGVNRFAFNKKYELNNMQHDLHSAVSVWNVKKKNHLERRQRLLKTLTGEAIFKEMSKFDLLNEKMKNSTRNLLEKEKERLHLNENAVRLLDPEKVLKRGYTLSVKEGRIVKSVKQLAVDDELETRFADGSVTSKITKTR